MNIGFFDSGVGGATIFKEAVKDIKANFYYLGDNKNAPYGIKSIEDVKKISLDAAEILIKKGCKIVVVACNTATSVAIKEMRDIYKDVIFIGTEPAIKLARDASNKKKVLVAATSVTIKGEKLLNLMDRLDMSNYIDTLALDKLVEFAEDGNYRSIKVERYLKEKLSKYNIEEYSHIVLGCTHFPLFKETFKSLIPNTVTLLDSSKGVVKNLKNNINLIDENEYIEESTIKLLISKQDENFVKNFKRIIENNNINVEVI